MQSSPRLCGSSLDIFAYFITIFITLIAMSGATTASNNLKKYITTCYKNTSLVSCGFVYYLF